MGRVRKSQREGSLRAMRELLGDTNVKTYQIVEIHTLCCMSVNLQQQSRFKRK